MNLQYLKYVAEIASCGSLSRAAEKLFIGQPTLTRAVKELESDLGTTLFERTARGMTLTPDGEIFLGYAKGILGQVNRVENLFRSTPNRKKQFSISVPRASYISEAFSEFSRRLSAEESLEVFYKETNALRAIKNILQEDYRLGILRYAESYDRYYEKMLSEKSLTAEPMTEFTYRLIMSGDSPLARLENITFADLAGHTEIAHADPYVPSLTVAEVKKEELPDMEKRIFVFERGSQFDLLSTNPDTFMWVSPAPARLLRRYGLVERECRENKRLYRDVLIYRSDYSLSALDREFIGELKKIIGDLFPVSLYASGKNYSERE